MDQAAIYTHHAAEYDELVSAEDCDGELIPAIEHLCALRGAAVLEVGIGTGRIARQIITQVASLVGIDRAPAMLELARQRLAAIPGAAASELLCADAGELPVHSACVDVAIAGWVFGHFREWMPDAWQRQVSQALAEMNRVLRPGGCAIVIETLGTGSEQPAAPTPGLAEYHAWLEQHGFQRTTIRTDYQFADVETAARITGFFFGEDFAARVRRERWTRIPECTGLWWRRSQGDPVRATARPGG